jgi:hypothetical protein
MASIDDHTYGVPLAVVDSTALLSARASVIRGV